MSRGPVGENGYRGSMDSRIESLERRMAHLERSFVDFTGLVIDALSKDEKRKEGARDALAGMLGKKQAPEQVLKSLGSIYLTADPKDVEAGEK